jgi:hypothetical protein
MPLMRACVVGYRVLCHAVVLGDGQSARRHVSVGAELSATGPELVRDVSLIEIDRDTRVTQVRAVDGHGMRGCVHARHQLLRCID